MTIDHPTLAFAAAVYNPRIADRLALAKFVDSLVSGQTRVGGILQESIFDATGKVSGQNAVNIADQSRIPITHPVTNDCDCGLDVSALAATAAILRAAVDAHMDLIVVEKFGEQEQNGKGLNDEILHAIATGIPLLCAVSETALPIWQQRTGELGSVLPFKQAAFRQWWRELRA